MAVKNLKIVLDTNWYLSASINSKSRRTIYPLLTGAGYRIFYSPELMGEYMRVIRRPFFAKKITAAQVNRFIQIVVPMLYPVKIKSAIQLSRDINDNHVLALALDAKADYLITGIEKNR
jgi:hypothetical protein